MSERTYLGQVNKSTDIASKGKDNDITNVLTFNNRRILEKVIKENRTKIRSNIKNAYCHPVPNITFRIAIKRTGIVYI